MTAGLPVGGSPRDREPHTARLLARSAGRVRIRHQLPLVTANGPGDLRVAMARSGSGADAAQEERGRLQMRIADLVQREGRFWISVAPVPGGFALGLNVISWSWLTDEALADAFLAEPPLYAQVAAADRAG